MTRQYRRRGLVDRRRPRVLNVAPGLVHESGPERHRDWAPERIAVMAHWSTDPEPSRSVVTMLRELDAAGFETMLVSAAEAVGPIGRTCTWAPEEPSMPDATTVLRRVNVGYDFGSWAAVLDAYPGIRRASRVLLVNDSLIGPFASLAPIVADFESCTTLVWGLSGSLQHRPHIQSFFMGYRNGVLDSPAMRAFWTDIRVESSKAKIVRFNELALAEALDDAGIGWRTMFAAEPDGGPNPTIDDWKRLLRQGAPVLKSEVVMSPPDHVADWDDLAPSLNAAFGQHLEDWVPGWVELGPPARQPGLQRIPRRARTILDIEGPVGLLRACAARGLRRTE